MSDPKYSPLRASHTMASFLASPPPSAAPLRFTMSTIRLEGMLSTQK